MLFNGNYSFARILRLRSVRAVWDRYIDAFINNSSAWISVGGNPYECSTATAKSGFTIIESVLTLVIIGSSLTVIFSLQTNVMKSVFGTHYIIEHIIGIRNFVVKDDQEQYYKQGKGFEKKIEDSDYSISYQPKSSKQVPTLSNYKNIVVAKMKISSKSAFLNHDEFVFFRFNAEGGKS